MDMFLNPVQKNNRTAIRLSESSTILSFDEKYIGHVFEPNGTYTTVYLKPGLDNLARFICSSDKDKLVADRTDNAVLCTIGNYVDIAVPSVNTQVLLPFLQKYQGTRNYPEFELA
jgi:hypothetical protein